MLGLLKEAEQHLVQLLKQDTRDVPWKSMFVDYHYPYVERLWIPWKEYRLSLHRILPCQTNESLFHPHPWPQAVKVMQGNYEMGIGWGRGEIPPPVATKIVVSSGFSYEMLDPDGWHYVRPIDVPSLSIMLTGKPWERIAPKSDKPLRTLTTEEILLLIRDVSACLGIAASAAKVE